jgi:hypothetical protein
VFDDEEFDEIIAAMDVRVGVRVRVPVRVRFAPLGMSGDCVRVERNGCKPTYGRYFDHVRPHGKLRNVFVSGDFQLGSFLFKLYYDWVFVIHTHTKKYFNFVWVEELLSLAYIRELGQIGLYKGICRKLGQIGGNWGNWLFSRMYREMSGIMGNEKGVI